MQGDLHRTAALGGEVAPQLGEKCVGADQLGNRETLPCPMSDSSVQRWAASGAMALTGLRDQPLGPPDGLVEGIDRLARSFPGLDGLALLGERAALMGLWRRGAVSCGGSCRLLPICRRIHGGVAPARRRHGGGSCVARARPSRHARFLPCGLRSPPTCATAIPSPSSERAELLGLPVAMVGEAAEQTGVRRSPLGDAPPRPDTGRIARRRLVGAVGGSSVWRPPRLRRRDGASRSSRHSGRTGRAEARASSSTF